uniref:Uncharacterized protein n=1 Tax=Oryza sativa subsp. japonica TaxID=39947 RepID=Q6K4A6_ORYSJ|nr:hypothetical protein [Oryza sativa Japonica Group]BAD22263.1 hypothetical protein [Oryza sativa Japonica Group]
MGHTFRTGPTLNGGRQAEEARKREIYTHSPESQFPNQLLLYVSLQLQSSQTIGIIPLNVD